MQAVVHSRARGLTLSKHDAPRSAAHCAGQYMAYRKNGPCRPKVDKETGGEPDSSCSLPLNVAKTTPRQVSIQGNQMLVDV